MSALLLLRAVAAARLLAVAHALGVEGAADDLVADSGQVPHPAAAHQHDRVLLQVVPDARDVRCDLDLAGEPDPRHLAQGGVWLLGRGRVDARANAAALGAALECRRGGLGYLVLAALSDQLLDSGHRVSVFFLLAPCGARPGRARAVWRGLWPCDTHGLAILGIFDARDLLVSAPLRPPWSGVSRSPRHTGPSRGRMSEREGLPAWAFALP